MLKHLLSHFYLLFGLTCISIAQTPSEEGRKYTHSIGLLTSKGFILNGSKSIGHMTLTHPNGYEAFFQWNTYGNKEWETYFNYPEVGLALNLQNPHNESLGYAISFTGYINFYILRRRHFELFYHGGFGTTYVTRPYNREDNNKNNLITTYFNYTLNPRIGANFILSSRTKLTTSLAIHHASNGAYRKPNKGMNVVAAEMGLVHRLERETPSYKNRIIHAPEIYPIRYNVIFAYGVKELNPTGGVKYPVYTLQTYADLRVQPFRSILIGLDFFSNMGVKEEIKRSSSVNADDPPDHRMIAVIGGQEVFFDRVSFLMQVGIYIYKPFKDSGEPIYQRIALKYNWQYRYSAHIALKVHYGSADSVEWGIGYRF